MELNSLIQKIAIWALPIIFAITLHEAAHGLAAKIFGDRTAEMLGRISLNPLRHIDPIGTVVVPLVMMMVSPFVFGWAKPVPVNFDALRNPKRDMMWVALAGPAANLVMAILWGLVIKLATMMSDSSLALPLGLMGQAGVIINAVLMVLNLLPLLPLDGGRVVASLLPGPLSYKYSLMEPYGFFILIALLATGILSSVLNPLTGMVIQLVYGLFGIGM